MSKINKIFILLLFAFVPSLAMADDHGDGKMAMNGYFYVGAEYQKIDVSYGTLNGVPLSTYYEEDLDAFAGYVGYRFNDNIGVELSYANSSEGEKNNVLGTGVNVTNSFDLTAVEAMLFLPVDSEKKFDIIGAIGLARVSAEAKASNATANVRVDDSENKMRFGIGAQYEIVENVRIRAMLRHQEADFSGDLDDAKIYSIGLNFSF